MRPLCLGGQPAARNTHRAAGLQSPLGAANQSPCDDTNPTGRTFFRHERDSVQLGTFADVLKEYYSSLLSFTGRNTRTIRPVAECVFTSVRQYITTRERRFAFPRNHLWQFQSPRRPSMKPRKRCSVAWDLSHKFCSKN